MHLHVLKLYLSTLHHGDLVHIERIDRLEYDHHEDDLEVFQVIIEYNTV